MFICHNYKRLSFTAVRLSPLSISITALFLAGRNCCRGRWNGKLVIVITMWKSLLAQRWRATRIKPPHCCVPLSLLKELFHWHLASHPLVPGGPDRGPWAADQRLYINHRLEQLLLQASLQANAHYAQTGHRRTAGRPHSPWRAKLGSEYHNEKEQPNMLLHSFLQNIAEH